MVGLGIVSCQAIWPVWTLIAVMVPVALVPGTSAWLVPKLTVFGGASSWIVYRLTYAGVI